MMTRYLTINKTKYKAIYDDGCFYMWVRCDYSGTWTELEYSHFTNTIKLWIDGNMDIEVEDFARKVLGDHVIPRG